MNSMASSRPVSVHLVLGLEKKLAWEGEMFLPCSM